MGSRLNILLIFLVSLLIGVPVWWKSTEVYRAEISSINTTHWKGVDAVPIRVSLHFIHPVSQNPDSGLVQLFTDSMAQAIRPIEKASAKTVPLSIQIAYVSAIPTDTQSMPQKERDSWLDTQLHDLPASGNENGRYSLCVIVNPSIQKPMATIGTYRSSWIEVARAEDATPLVPVLAAQLKHMLLNDVKSDNLRKNSYRLTFSLLNEDPVSTITSWNFARLSEVLLSDVVKTFSRAHNLMVESQVVHYTQLKHQPSFDESKSEYFFTPATLPHFVDGTEWKVDSGSDAKEKTLHFAVFVPSPDHSPLVIHHGPKSVSTAFIMSEWGGISIHNLPLGAERPRNFEFQTANFMPHLQVFITQLRQLFNLPTYAPTIPSPNKQIESINILPATRRGASEFEIDALTRKQLWHTLGEVQHTLTQFTIMMEQISNIPIYDHIHDKLIQAMYARDKAVELLTSIPFNHDLAHTAAADSLVDAEEIFFDKDMVGMLYFPSGHELAIYLPLFLPLSFPIITGLRAEIARRRQKAAGKQLK